MKLSKFKLPKWLLYTAVIWTLVIALSTVSMASVTGNLPDGLTASGGGTFAWNVSESQISVTASPSSSTSCGSTSYNARNDTLTLTSSVAAKLVVSVSKLQGNGTVKLNDVAVSVGTSTTYTLEEGGTVSIYISSGGNTNESTTLGLDISYMLSGNSVSVEFQPVQGVAYKVNGQPVSAEAAILSGDPADGFAVVADSSNYVLTGAALEDGNGNTTVISALGGKIFTTVSGKITPVFAYDQDADGVAPFMVGNNYYWDWDSAKTAAGNSGTVILNDDYTLPAGEYVVPSGVTLLIPHDSAATMWTSGTTACESTAVTPTIYRKLTLASGAHISVAGTINVSAKINTKMAASSPNTAVGVIEMNGNSTITVENKGKLYAWGFIAKASEGEGSVTVKSGGTVYEYMQMTDWRGGSATRDMMNNSGKVFPMSKYYLQNVQVPMTIEVGASEYVFVGVDVSYVGIQTATPKLIGGANDDNVLFKITSGSLTKDFNESTERTEIEVNGDVAVSNFTISIKVSALGSVELKAEKYIMPISHHFTVNINSGSNLTITQDVALLPGCELTVDKGANCTLNEGTSLHIYDLDAWKGYYSYTGTEGGKEALPVPYIYDAGAIKTPTNKTLTKDAVVTVEGVLDASKGYVYTTAAGDVTILGKEDGELRVMPGTATLAHQASSTSDSKVTYHEVPITSLKLSGTAGNKAAGQDTYIYNNSVWNCVNHVDTNTDSICDFCNQQFHVCTGTLANGQAPDCTADGWKDYVTCSCGKFYSDAECKNLITDLETWKQGDGKLGTTGHAWSVSYTFADDGSSCTATRVCGNDASHTETATATIEAVEKAPASFDADGWTTYTATFEGVSWAETQTKDVQDIPALTPVAQVGETQYASLGAALAAAGEGGKVTLLADVNESVEIAQTVTIYKNGCTAENLTPGSGYCIGEHDNENDAKDSYVIWEDVDEITYIGNNLSVEGKVDLNLRFYIPSELCQPGAFSVETKIAAAYTPDDVEINRTVTAEEILAAGIDEAGRYVLTFSLASGQMTAPVEMTFKQGDAVLPVLNNRTGVLFEETFVRSILDYAEDVFARGKDKDKQLALNMLLFGGYAQQYFEVDEENPAYGLISEIDGMVLPELKNYGIQGQSVSKEIKLSGDNTVIDAESIGQSLVLKEDTTIKTFFRLAEGVNIEDLSITMKNPDNSNDQSIKEMTVTDTGDGRYMVEIENIPAAFWDNAYYIYVKNVQTGETVTIETTVLGWALRCIDSAKTDEAQKNMAKAMFFFNKAANEYFPGK